MLRIIQGDTRSLDPNPPRVLKRDTRSFDYSLYCVGTL